MRIGEMLIAQGECNEADIEQALSIQKDFGGRLGTILLNSGVISEGVLIQTLANQLQIPRLIPFEPDEEAIKALLSMQGMPQISLLKESDVYPFALQEGVLQIALHDPLQSNILTLIENQTECDLALYLGTEAELRPLKECFALDSEDDEVDYLEDEIDRIKELASETPIIKLVNNIMTKAADAKASDIHFEAFQDGIEVRMRVDGSLALLERIPKALSLAVVARLKLISKMNITENRLPQDGRISIKVAGNEIDIRASSVPTAFGESFVLRLLGKQAVSYALDSLDFYEDHKTLLKSLIAKPNGILLTTGPTGSGKTTTLYSVLNALQNETNKIITVEDPVEYEFRGISQIQVNSEIDYTFANALRSILRQDPDIIMVGEIRDRETAEIAIQAL